MAQINKPNQYFNTKLYTGNGSTQSITGVGFQPDMIWVKQRNAVRNHVIEDAVRGTTKALYPNLTNAEENQATSITSFDSDGFSTGAFDDTNISAGTFASWNWLASNTTASNTDGSITSTVSANTTSGFSIVSYTGNSTGSATFGHGLGSTPKIVIIKCRSLGTESWQFWFNNTSRLNLNSTVASLTTHPISTNSTLVTTPSSSNDSWNTSGQTYIAYCFAEKKGFSKFGTYTGNGSTDGTFIYTGFKPAFVMTKPTNIADHWEIGDTAREPYNPVDDMLIPSLSNSEGNVSPPRFDILSNGFKARTSNGATNGSGNSYIYMAFAESPLVGTNNIPAVAR